MLLWGLRGRATSRKEDEKKDQNGTEVLKEAGCMQKCVLQRREACEKTHLTTAAHTQLSGTSANISRKPSSNAHVDTKTTAGNGKKAKCRAIVFNSDFCTTQNASGNCR